MRSISSTALPRIPLEERAFSGSGNVGLPMLLCALALAGIGAATINSASAELPLDYLPRQLVWISLGAVAFAIGIALSYHFLLRVAWWIYSGSLVALVLVNFFGHEAGGARSWIGFAGLGGQPSDLMKVATAVLLARYLAGRKVPILETRQVLAAAAIAAVPMIAVVVQPDLGGAVMFLPIAASMVLVAGVRARLVLIAFLLVAVSAGGLWTFGMRDYQRDRIMSFVQPERDPLGAGYQLRQSKIAVGSGQVLGKGYMQGTQSQLRFLPARHTDFIFAVLAEERGFLGVIVVMMLYAIYFASAMRAALRARDRGGMLLVAGLASVIATYVLYNTAMMIGLVPVTGIPLPFLSYGGSFTLFCLFSTGLIAGVDRRRYVNR